MRRVFISHSSEDAELAMSLCVDLEKKGQRCWIAPRDIDYGEKWAEQIAASLINDTGLFVFLLSEHSNRSEQVLKEINIAIHNEIPMLVIGIEKVEKMNLSLVYYLSNLHIFECQPEDEERRVKLVLERMKELTGSSYDGAADKKAEGQITETKRRRLTSARVWDDPISKKLAGIINRNLLDFWASFSSTPFSKESMNCSPDAASESLDKLDLTGPLGGDTMDGKYVSLMGTEELDTLIFQINRKIDPNTYDVYFALEKIDIAIEYMDNQLRRQTFFFDNPAPDGNHLVLITINDEKEYVQVNMGFLDYDHIKIAKSSMLFSDFENHIKKGEQKTAIVPKGTSMAAIDIETHKAIMPRERYNEETGLYEDVLDLQAENKYFVFSANAKDNQKRHASDAEIGYAYYTGFYGLPKNWMKAAEAFMRSDDPKSYFYLGVIFWRDPVLRDIDLAKEYFQKAREAGIEVSDRIMEEVNKQESKTIQE